MPGEASLLHFQCDQIGSEEKAVLGSCFHPFQGKVLHRMVKGGENTEKRETKIPTEGRKKLI